MTTDRIETLRYAVRWRMLLKYLGMPGAVLAAVSGRLFPLAGAAGLPYRAEFNFFPGLPL